MEVIAYAAFFDCTPEALLEKPAAMEYGSLSLDFIREALYKLECRMSDLEDLEQAHHTTLKGRVDFIVEAINTLQGTADEPKELF